MDDKSSSVYSPNGGMETASSVSMPDIVLHIQCSTTRPPNSCYDAYQYLDTVKVPGSDKPKTVADRRAERGQ